MEQKKFEMIAKTLYGLEDVLAEELQAIGADDVTVGKRMVSFTGDMRMLYKANFHCRTALRILKPVAHFKAYGADNVYEGVKQVEWDNYFTPDDTFVIDAVVYSESFNHSKFVAYKTKDAIADYFNEKYDKRPSVSVKNPDFFINIHISHNDCTISLDSSGESLHRRGYRINQGEAPLSEVLAAGMILKTGWRGESNFVDPFCGSGTLLIEAAMIALNIAPGVYRKEYAFEKWKDFDGELFDEIYNDDSEEKSFDFKCYGSDISPLAIEKATGNVKNAGLTKYISMSVKPFQQFSEPAQPGILVTNPPYGERISSDDLLGLYGMIGERLKHAFMGYDAWILSYKEEFFDNIGLRPKEKIKLMNGELECEFRCYELFEGKNKEFKANREERGDDRKRERKYERGDDRKNERGNEIRGDRRREWANERGGRNDRRNERGNDRRNERGGRSERGNDRRNERGNDRRGERKKEWGSERKDDRKAGRTDVRKFERKDSRAPSFRGAKPFGERPAFNAQRPPQKDRRFETNSADGEERALRLERSDRHNRLAARHKGIVEKETRTKRNAERKEAGTKRNFEHKARENDRPKFGKDRNGSKPYKKKRYED